ncbi:MAG: hypothetical protein L3J37_09925 [Rhodobacteraceae bacterium]|nr:hypothetical protein [Paracoccaceae bacterium]
MSGTSGTFRQPARNTIAAKRKGVFSFILVSINNISSTYPILLKKKTTFTKEQKTTVLAGDCLPFRAATA